MVSKPKKQDPKGFDLTQLLQLFKQSSKKEEADVNRLQINSRPSTKEKIVLKKVRVESSRLKPK